MRYVDGAYNLASGTRDAFGGLSAQLVREGHPDMVSISGDREPEDQLRIWHQRMTLSPGGRKVYGTAWWNGQKWYRIHPDLVGVPLTSNHEKRRSDDLAWPYNSDTAAHRRARAISQNYGITCEGLGFSSIERWHWTFWGALGTIGAPAAAGGSTARPTPVQEDDMATLISSPGGKSLVVGDRLFGFTDPTEAAAVSGVQTLNVPIALHARINDEFGRTAPNGALPTIVYVRGGNGTVYLLTQGKLEALVDQSTLAELHGKNAPTFTLSQAEVDNLLKS